MQGPDSHPSFRACTSRWKELGLKNTKSRTLVRPVLNNNKKNIFLSGPRRFWQDNSCYLLCSSPTGPIWSACIMTPDVRYQCTGNNHSSKANYSLRSEKRNWQFPTLSYYQSQCEWSFKKKKKTTSKRCIPPSELNTLASHLPFCPSISALNFMNFSSFTPCIAKRSLKTTSVAILLSFWGSRKREKNQEKYYAFFRPWFNLIYCWQRPQSKQKVGLETSRGSFWLCIFVILYWGFLISLSWNQVMTRFCFIMVLPGHLHFQGLSLHLAWPLCSDAFFHSVLHVWHSTKPGPHHEWPGKATSKDIIPRLEHQCGNTPPIMTKGMWWTSIQGWIHVPTQSHRMLWVGRDL